MNKEKIIPAKKLMYLDGARSRATELSFAWKVFNQFIKGMRMLHFVGPCITVFGSARFNEQHEYYIAAREFGKRIAAMGFTTLTGGGPGIMEAANKGAFENGGYSIGCNIKLPFEQKPNLFVHKSITFEHFFTRKTLLIKYSYAFIIMPGGVGTMDELFETLTLIQTKTIKNFPVVLYGIEYYQPLINYLELMANEKTIDPDDLKLVLLTEDFDEAIQHIEKYTNANFNLQKRKKFWWLLETK